MFVQQPSSAGVGATITPAVTVQVQDASGNNMAVAGISITVALTTGTGTLSGTLTQTTNSSGLATFNDLSINQPGSKNLTASSLNLTSAVSNSFVIGSGRKGQTIVAWSLLPDGTLGNMRTRTLAVTEGE